MLCSLGGLADNKNVFRGVVRKLDNIYTDDEIDAIAQLMAGQGSSEEEIAVIRSSLSAPSYYIGGTQDTLTYAKFIVDNGTPTTEEHTLPLDNKLNQTAIVYGDTVFNIEYLYQSLNISFSLLDKNFKIVTDSMPSVYLDSIQVNPRITLTRLDNNAMIWLYAAGIEDTAGFGNSNQEDPTYELSNRFFTDADVGKEVAFRLDKYYIDYSSGQASEPIPWPEN